MTDQAVVVFDPVEAAKSLSREVRKKSTGIAELLGVDPSADDPKEAAKAKAMFDRFVTVAIHAATSDPKILRATRESLIQSIRDSALLGLEPVGSTGDGAIVVYEESVKRERPGRNGGMVIFEEKIPIAHFQPMYRGLLKLARRSDQIAHVDAHVVYQGDEINLDLGSSPSVRHFPVLDGAKRGDVVGAYAVAELTNGRRYVEWMTKADIEEVRKSSRGNTSSLSPWVRFWTEMARKTVLRRLMKRLPLETMAEHALRIENEAESGPRLVASSTDQEATPALESSSRRRLRARFGKETEEPSGDASGGNAPTSPPEPTETAGGTPRPLSVDPTASEARDAALEGEIVVDGPTALPVREICGAGTDPALGDVVYCTLEPGHGGTLHVATDAKGELAAKWPNR